MKRSCYLGFILTNLLYVGNLFSQNKNDLIVNKVYYLNGSKEDCLLHRIALESLNIDYDNSKNDVLFFNNTIEIGCFGIQDFNKVFYINSNKDTFLVSIYNVKISNK